MTAEWDDTVCHSVACPLFKFQVTTPDNATDIAHAIEPVLPSQFVMVPRLESEMEADKP